MSAYIGVQPVGSAQVRPEIPSATFRPMPTPLFTRKSKLTHTQLEILDLVREDIRAVSSIQPIHRTLALSATKNPAKAIIDELGPLHSTTFPVAVKALVLSAGLTGATLFATSNILPSPDNTFGGILIGLITLLTLPIISAEFTNRTLSKEFETIPLDPDHLPTLGDILDKGFTPEQFGAFVEHDLLPRIPIGHFRSTANESGTCLHDITHWARGEQHFSGTSWETVHQVIEDLGVGQNISLRVKAALLVIERDRTLNEASLPDINATLAEIAKTISPMT